VQDRSQDDLVKTAINKFVYAQMSVEAIKKEFVPKYLAAGEPKFYRLLLLYALNKLIHIEKGSFKGKSPELEFLDVYDQFIILYRREGEEVYLDLARVFRKAAHKVYRVMIKKKMTEKNERFLNLV
jgi:hypothetical protein